VINNLRNIAQAPVVLSDVLRRIEEERKPGEGMAEPAAVEQALLKFDPLWDHLTMWEQETYIRTLVAHVRYDGRTGQVTVGFHSEGIKQLCSSRGSGE
jgi:hypothetical protein